ncbi:hypothetical protein P12x_000792 [Tundrisphaera lichenicola]|uniref:hypothetical protein n=1 Tax=Tundrisphaera lichenicola TaxID=2029860 RepID=UPI003EBDE003
MRGETSSIGERSGVFLVSWLVGMGTDGGRGGVEGPKFAIGGLSPAGVSARMACERGPTGVMAEGSRSAIRRWVAAAAGSGSRDRRTMVWR